MFYNSNIIMVYVFLYFQCNPQVENHVVLQNLATNSRRLVILGGGCVHNGDEPAIFPPATQGTDRNTRVFIPQV